MCGFCLFPIKSGHETPFLSPFSPLFLTEASKNLALDSFHPDALEKIGSLEGKPVGVDAGEEEVFSPPVFTTHLDNLVFKEGEDAVLKCQVAPVNDPNLKIGKSSAFSFLMLSIITFAFLL